MRYFICELLKQEVERPRMELFNLQIIEIRKHNNWLLSFYNLEDVITQTILIVKVYLSDKRILFILPVS